MQILSLDTPGDPRVADYEHLTDVALRKRLETQRGLFMAESLQIIMRAIEAGHRPRSFLALPKWLPEIEPLAQEFDVPIYVGTATVLHGITGFAMHRGALSAMERYELPSVEQVVESARLIVIIEDVVDHTNVGAIFRSVAAIGADAVLVSPHCADPLYRRAVRVSMGTVFQVPWTRIHDWHAAMATLHRTGFSLVALALSDDAIDIRAAAASRAQGRTALVVGTEGTGLSKRALSAADMVATIPMRNGVDSLNVAAASAVALWEFARAQTGDHASVI